MTEVEVSYGVRYYPRYDQTFDKLAGRRSVASGMDLSSGGFRDLVYKFKNKVEAEKFIKKVKLVKGVHVHLHSS